MDPNAALLVMIEHMAEGERDGALDILDALRDWMIGGGAMPERAARELAASGRREAIKRLTKELHHEFDEIDRSR